MCGHQVLLPNFMTFLSIMYEITIQIYSKVVYYRIHEWSQAFKIVNIIMIIARH